MTHDVLISGLGPTGAVLACLLGQRGVRVAVFDALEDLYPLPRAVGLDHEAMRIFQEMGITKEITPFIDHYRPSEYLGVDGKLIKRLDKEPAPYRLGWEPNYVFNQPQLEAVVRSKLDLMAGVDVHKCSQVLSVDQGLDSVEIRVKHHHDGQEKRYGARYLIACDGGSSPIRKSLGIELEDLGFNESWLVIDALVPPDISARLPQTQVQYCEPERPSTFVFCTANHRRWEIMLSDDEYRAGDFPDEMLWPMLSRWVQPGEVKLWRRAAYRFHGLIAKQWRQGSVFLAGDAAHMTPPFMAQGMVQGLRDAHNLAWKLTYVLQGKSDASLLDTYEVERQPHVRSTTQKAIELGRLICERDPEQARLRDHKLRQEQGGTIQTTYRQQMIPGLTAGLIHLGDPLAGSVFPQPQVKKWDAEVLLDDLISGDFVLYVDADLLGHAVTTFRFEVGQLPIQIVLLTQDAPSHREVESTIASSLLFNWMRVNEVTAVLVRPDKYVFGTADSVNTVHTLIGEVKKCFTSAALPSH